MSDPELTEPESTGAESAEQELPEAEGERLRLALTLIGDEASRTEPLTAAPAPVRVRVRVRRSRRRRKGLLVGALVGAAALCAGMLTLTLPDGGNGRPDSDGMGQSNQEGIACARLIVEAVVVAVRDAPEDGRLLVSFDVQEWIKPGSGADRIELDLVDPAVAQVQEPWRKGVRVLLTVPLRRDLEAYGFSGKQLEGQRKILDHYLPLAKKTECPEYWRTPQD
ncbi:hypothetical protein ACFT9I_05875 [Streptomyces sp. NPDC057137]|uniref:hypothetical protein n=1 Tax=Streptomyces sp. NPDC057137 TaxID=3346030 RepID=UPI003635EFF5